MDITLLSADTDEFLSGLPADTALALGMSWAPMTAGLQTANALSMALSAKATHLVHASGKSSVGLARMTRADLKHLAKHNITRVLSAASLLADAKPVGTSLVTLAIAQDPQGGGEPGGEAAHGGEELVWLGAVSNGAVLRGHDVVVTKDRAEEIWLALQERYSEKASRFDEVSGFGWNDLIELAAERQPESAATMALLRPAKAGSLAMFKRIPKPVKYVGVILGAAALVQYMVLPVVHYEIARYKRAHAPKVDARAMWQDAYVQWAASHKMAAAKAGQQVMAALGAVPTVVANWTLSTAVCDMDTAHGKWKCAVTYKWPVNGVGERASTNAQFAALAPKEWNLDWSPMGGVTGRFFVKADTSKMNPNLLHTEQWHLVNTVSYLQKFNRVLQLSTKPLTNFARVPIQAPRLKSGQVVPAPVGVKLPLVATVKVDGPMRTMVEKMIFMPDVSWEKVSISIDDTAKPDRNKSELKANLQGEIYAKP